MTLSEILSNEDLRHREFPVTREKIFLAHAGVCPLPRRVADAMADCAAKGTLGDQEEFMLSRLVDARKLGAQLLNCQSEEVAPRRPNVARFEFRRLRSGSSGAGIMSSFITTIILPTFIRGCPWRKEMSKSGCSTLAAWASSARATSLDKLMKAIRN